MDYNFLAKTELFKAMTVEEIKNILDCLKVTVKKYKKNEYILRRGDIVTAVCLVLSGSVNIEKDEICGSHSIISNIPKGCAFAEAYACSENKTLMIDAVSAENTEIMFINIDYMLTICSSGCQFHNKLIKNLITVIAEKNIILTRKINIITPKTIRERLLTYFFYEMNKHKSCDFVIPFNRQQLANYLCVDRSAMSNELSKMQKEGLISYKKDKFHIDCYFTRRMS